MTDKCKTYPVPPTDILLQCLLSCDFTFHNLSLITWCDGHLLPSSEPPSLTLTDSCYFSPLACIYLFSKNSPAVSTWGDAGGVFVICGHWSAAPQLHDVRLRLIRCTAAEMLSVAECVKPLDASQTLPPLPPPSSHVLATRGWVSGQLLQWWE